MATRILSIGAARHHWRRAGPDLRVEVRRRTRHDLLRRQSCCCPRRSIDGPMIHHAVVSGLLATGCEVLDADVCTTPTCGVLVKHFGAAGGLQITASHNPIEWNGLNPLLRMDLSSTKSLVSNSSAFWNPKRSHGNPGRELAKSRRSKIPRSHTSTKFCRSLMLKRSARRSIALSSTAITAPAPPVGLGCWRLSVVKSSCWEELLTDASNTFRNRREESWRSLQIRRAT